MTIDCNQTNLGRKRIAQLIIPKTSIYHINLQKRNDATFNVDRLNKEFYPDIEKTTVYGRG